MKQRLLLLAAAFCTFSVTALAQGGLAGKVQLTVQPGQTYTIKSASADALGVKCESCTFDKAYFLAGPDTVRLAQDEHSDQLTALAVLPAPT
ncbi:hypothetical protein [Rufibacter sp. LB8]|uniref:hypothetical protein n=1 Tax=Rufibacter sp. LB8 TaxID=2777781 RepID=UPI00178C5416|nr:hypothetical protein [Rufibacter sp. LB8]